MKIIESILTKNPCYTAGRKIEVRGLMLHSVGTPQPSAGAFIKLFNQTSYNRACVHGFIDANDGTVYQTLPWDHRGWHAGGNANNTHIGIEMCEPASIKYTSGSGFTCSNKSDALAAVKRTYDSAVLLFAILCWKFNLDPMADGVIISHREGYIRGIATNHGDPEHLWNQLGSGYTMNGFRKDVKSAMGLKSEVKETSYQVKVEISNLNIRSMPTVESESRGKLIPGIYTIVAEQDGAGASKWGKLKSGAGWISLDYCKKVTLGEPVKHEDMAGEAIDKLFKLGVINSPDYWKKALHEVMYLDKLFIKAASVITGAGTRIASTEDAIRQLVRDGIIDSPDYWLIHYRDHHNLGALLCAFGGAEKG